MADKLLKTLRPTLTGGTPGWVMPAGYFLALQQALFQGAASALVVAATITPNLLVSPWITATFAANTVSAIQIPTGVPAGQIASFSITIINTSGAGLTNITFVAAYKTAALTYPATTKNRTYSFWTDGTNAYQITDAGDVAN